MASMEDSEVERRRSDEHVAQVASEMAHGIFLRADEVARIRYHLDRVQRGIEGDAEMTGIVFRLLDDYGMSKIELVPISPGRESYPVGLHPSAHCPQCGGKSFDFGNAYHECRSCGHAYLLVAAED
jgi:hypothetical protein